MLYREYGKTGKKVSVLGFGGMRFIKEEYDKDPELCARLVRYASEKGINYFDTAPGYCEDRSEIIMGLAFKNMPHPFYVSTKSSYWSDKTADDVRRRCETSLKRLGVDKIHFYHMWCIMNMQHYKNVMAPGGPYEGAVKLREEGLIDHICISTHANGTEIEQIVRQNQYEGILLGYNATNFAFRQQGLKASYQQGMGVVTMNPLGGGVIPNNPEYYSFIVRNPADTLAQSALKFNVSHNEITVVLSGMSTMDEIDENTKACEVYEEITQDQWTEYKKHLHSSLDSLCTGCGYCDSCPVGIPIPKMMDSYNLRILSSSPQDVANRIKYHWGLKVGQAGDCTECGHCEALCTQHLPIIERLKEISQIDS
jgi:uncharacterized protein